MSILVLASVSVLNRDQWWVHSQPEIPVLAHLTFCSAQRLEVAWAATASAKALEFCSTRDRNEMTVPGSDRREITRVKF